MDSSLSIYNTNKVTNEDVVINYTPSKDVINYEYIIYQDKQFYKSVNVSANTPSIIILNETGTYEIVVTENLVSGRKNILKSGQYEIDKDIPILEVGDEHLTLKQGKHIDIMGNVQATDNFDGDLTGKVTTNVDKIKLNKIGNHKLIYTVSDTAGNEVSKTVYIQVVKDNTIQLLITQCIILLTLFSVLSYFIKYNKGLSIEKRIARYSVKLIKDYSRSFFGSIIRFTDNIIYRISKFLDKSIIAKRSSKRYNKYVKAFGKDGDTGLTIIAQKVVMSIIFTLTAILSKTIRLQVLSMYELFIPILVGYYFLDIIYESKYRSYRKKIENDFLQAIIVMNNAFKSGRSIYQAVELVLTELKGPISQEFKKIALEISYGLDIEVAFKRFAERIEIEEVAYLTASLSITNKTGGNIIRVFDSIEKTLFNRKKLKLELKSLTSSSKLIMYVLMLVPVFFITIISILNSSYFLPLFSTPLGYALIVIMIIIYITYIILVRRIIRVRM